MTDHTQPSAGRPAPLIVLDMLLGLWRSRLIYVAAKLEIADHLKHGPLSSEMLAAATGTHAPSLYRVLRALANEGLFVEQPDGRFALTPLAECLRRDVPNSMHAMALMVYDDWEFRSWENLLYSVTTGEPALEHLFQMERFDYLEQNPESRQHFDEAMGMYSSVFYEAITRSYDFSQAQTIADLGGGDGSLLAAILTQYPQARGILYELPAAMNYARHLLERHGVIDRTTLIGGSFLEAAPGGADLYIIHRCLHNWGDASVARILAHVRQVIPATGRLLTVDMLIPAEREMDFIKLLDVDMLLTSHGGRERTEEEFRGLLADAGFTLQRVLPVPATPLNILESVPV
jgi:SAM-dependent methyltransferase